MILRYSQRFLRSYRKAPKAVQDVFEKQSLLLLQNLHHPSLRAKKYDDARGLWQARVNYFWRCSFTIAGDTYPCTKFDDTSNSAAVKCIRLTKQKDGPKSLGDALRAEGRN